MIRTTILHVEDEPSDRLIVSFAFQKVAPEIDLRIAIDGDEAVEYLSGRGVYQDRVLHPVPTLVLLDIKLPKKSGFEVLQWMRSRAELREIPVLMMTSSNEPGDVGRAYEAGANSYLVKAADLQLMREMVGGIGTYARLLTEPRQTPALGATGAS